MSESGDQRLFLNRQYFFCVVVNVSFIILIILFTFLGSACEVAQS